MPFIVITPEESRLGTMTTRENAARHHSRHLKPEPNPPYSSRLTHLMLLQLVSSFFFVFIVINIRLWLPLSNCRSLILHNHALSIYGHYQAVADNAHLKGMRSGHFTSVQPNTPTNTAIMYFRHRFLLVHPPHSPSVIKTDPRAATIRSSRRLL